MRSSALPLPPPGPGGGPITTARHSTSLFPPLSAIVFSSSDIPAPALWPDRLGSMSVYCIKSGTGLVLVQWSGPRLSGSVS